MLPRAVCWYAQDEVRSYVQHPKFMEWFPGAEQYSCPWTSVFGESAISEREVIDKFQSYRPEGNTFDRASGPVAIQVPSVPNAFLMYPGLREKIPSYSLMDVRSRLAVPAPRVIVPSQALPVFPRNPIGRRSKSRSRSSHGARGLQAGKEKRPKTPAAAAVHAVPQQDLSSSPGTAAGAGATSYRRPVEG